MPKEYKIKTIEDIQKIVTKENIDNFLIDLKGFLLVGLDIKELQEELGSDFVEIKREEQGVFNWIDDGKTEAHITIKVEKNN